MKWRRAAIGALCVGLAFSVAPISSLAVLTSSAEVSANTFSASNVDIATDKSASVLILPEANPGDASYGSVQVFNPGAEPLRYAVTSVTTEDVLAAQLSLTIKSGVTTCTNTGFNASGTQLYSGPFGKTATQPLIGSVVRGSQAGDRTLAKGASEALCMRVGLPISTGVSYQGMTTSATINFVAEQTKNN